MALLNNHYIFVESEDVTRGLEVSKHAMETGIDMTDNVKRQPISISLSGEIVGADASATLNAITQLHQGGKLVSYSGRNVIKNAMITKFDTGHPNTIYGGCSFSMEITEVRIAKSAYVRPVTVTVVKQVAMAMTKSGTQQITKNSTAAKYHTVKSGDSRWLIAKSYNGNGSQYKKIYEANKDKLSSPNAIKVGQKLLIP